MKKMLKQITTGQLYVWTEQLASREDMVLVVIGAPAPEPEKQVEIAENTSQNPIKASADESPEDDIDKVVEAFRRQVTKPGRKPSKVAQPKGDA